RSMDALAEAPVTDDPGERGRVALLAYVLLVAVQSDPERFRMAAALIVGRSLRHGPAPFSSVGYAAYGYGPDGHGRVQPRPPGADRGRVARRMAERLDGRGTRARVLGFGAIFGSPWRRPLHESLEPLEQAHAGALAAGALRFSAITAVQRLL